MQSIVKSSRPGLNNDRLMNGELLLVNSLPQDQHPLSSSTRHNMAGGEETRTHGRVKQWKCIVPYDTTDKTSIKAVCVAGANYQ